MLLFKSENYKKKCDNNFYLLCIKLVLMQFSIYRIINYKYLVKETFYVLTFRMNFYFGHSVKILTLNILRQILFTITILLNVYLYFKYFHNKICFYDNICINFINTEHLIHNEYDYKIMYDIKICNN